MARGIKPEGCKRVMCQFFAKGTCKKAKCSLAHEDDKYPVVIKYQKLRQKFTHPSPQRVVGREGDGTGNDDEKKDVRRNAGKEEGEGEN